MVQLLTLDSYFKVYECCNVILYHVYYMYSCDNTCTCIIDVFLLFLRILIEQCLTEY